MPGNAELVQRLSALAQAEDPAAVAELDRFVRDSDPDVRFWAMVGLSRQGRVTPRYLQSVVEMTGFGEVLYEWPDTLVARIRVPDEPERARLLADAAVVACFAGLLRVVGLSRNAQGLVGLCAAIVEARAADLDGAALREAATMPGARQFDVELDDSRGGHLPRVIEHPLPPLDLARLRELARAELARRGA